MTATLTEIKGWYAQAKKDGALFLVVAHDQFDHDNYPCYMKTREELDKKLEYLSTNSNLQSVEEVYDLSIPFDETPKPIGHRVMQIPKD